MKNTWTCAVLLILAICAMPAIAQPNPVPLPNPVPPPGHVYLGIWANPELGGTNQNQEQAIETRESHSRNGIGRTFALHLHYYGWTKLAEMLDSSGMFRPDADLQGDIDHHRIPVISWVCDGTGTNSDAAIAGDDPNENLNIKNTAKALAQYPGPVLLRWFWEFNVLVNNQKCRGDSGGPPTEDVYKDFKRAWRHIRNMFRQQGATNVFFLWNPGHYDSDKDPKDPRRFYPGDEFVDWIGLDTYQRSPTSTFADDFGLFYQDFASKQKPLMIGENASPNFAIEKSELQWTYLQGLLAEVQAGQYPQLEAYCYFDSKPKDKDNEPPDKDKPRNWILDDNNGQGKGGLAALALIGASAVFGTRPTPTPKPPPCRGKQPCQQ